MNHSIHVPRWPRRAGPPAARTAAAVIAMPLPAPLAVSRNLSTPIRRAGPYAALLVAVALLAAACGGSSAPSGQLPSMSSSSRSAKLLAFSQCMRSHGAPQFPAPEPGQPEFKLPGPNQGAYGISGSQLWSAAGKCRHLLPPGLNAWYPQSEIPRTEQGLRAFARCMRSHGISQWPDPSFDSEGRLAFFGPGADNPPGSPTDHAMNQCSYLAPLGASTDFLGG
jgi:hypothetical protein